MPQTTYNPVDVRLRNRAREDEQTVEETIERLLDETVVEVELETVVEKAMNEFDHVASITITHIESHERPSIIRVTVHTGELGDPEDHTQLFTPDHKIAIDRGDETILAPFSIYATWDGPVTWDSKQQTTIYMDDDILGAESVQLKDGLAYLRDKLENPDQWEQERGLELDRIRNYTD